jgi:hypothetical protein
MGWKVQGKHYKYLPSSFVQCPFQIVLFACALAVFTMDWVLQFFYVLHVLQKEHHLLCSTCFIASRQFQSVVAPLTGERKYQPTAYFQGLIFFFKLTYHQKRIKQCSIWGAGGTGCLVLPNVQLVIVSLFMVMSIHCSYLLLWVIKWNFC